MSQCTGNQLLAITVDVAQQPHEQLVSLVESTAFGSDGLQYYRLSVRSQLDRFCEPVYFHAIVENKLVGVYVLDKRDLLVKGQRVRGYYRCVLAVHPAFQGKGIGKKLTTTATAWMTDQGRRQAVVSYGCIDQSNQRSLNLLQSAGARIGSTLSMYMMYRQWPSEVCQLDALEGTHAEEVRLLEEQLYADCDVRDVSVSRLPGLVLRDARGIAICARAIPTSFKITKMGRLAAWITGFLVRPFGAARKRFDPDCFCYVSFSEVLIRPGCEKLWPQFLGTVLAQNHCHFGAVYVHPDSFLFMQLQKAQPFARYLHSTKGSINVVWQHVLDNDDLHVPLPDNTMSTHVWPVDA